MISLNDRGGNGTFNSSFLPEDYLREKSEKRMNLLGVVLFCVVMFAVVAAFFVTNRETKNIQALQEQVSSAYAAEQQKIAQLKQLDDQRKAMLEKAEITTALLERVPRSVLFAEMINRMPERLTLTDFKLKVERRRVVAAPAPDPKARSRSMVRGAKANQQANEPPKPTPPAFVFTLEIVGLAGADADVADFHRLLTQCELLAGVDLVSSRRVLVRDVELREFKIDARISEDADARHIEPLKIPRGRVAVLPNRQDGGRMAERLLREQGLGDRRLRTESEDGKSVSGVPTGGDR